MVPFDDMLWRKCDRCGGFYHTFVGQGFWWCECGRYDRTDQEICDDPWL
jgi:hypothetical protein